MIEFKNKTKAEQKKLLAKVMRACIGYGLLTVIILGGIIGAFYWNDRVDTYEYKGRTLCQGLIDYIDVNKLEEYLTTHREDDYYQLVQKHMDNVRHYCNIKYFYVFVPTQDGIMFVWDADEGQDPETIGSTEAYSEGDKEYMLGILYGEEMKNYFEVFRDDEWGVLGCTYVPMQNSKGKNVALVGAEFVMGNIRKEILQFILKMLLGVIAATLLVLTPFFFMIKRDIVVPVKMLNDVTKTLVDHIEDDEALKIDIHTGDEIEGMAVAFTRMDTELKNYIKNLAAVTAEKERIGAELNIATRIQDDMLPKDFIKNDNVEVYATMRPAKEVGGDFYDFFMVDDDHLAIVMADVSGKGVPAALFMAISKTLLQDRTLVEDDLGSVFTGVNNILCQNNTSGMFVTAFEGVLDLKTGEFSFVNAGHEPPFCRKSGKDFKMHKLKPSLVLACMEGMNYTAGKVMLEPGDRLFQYTDGVTEATNADDELFELDRLSESLNRHKDEDPVLLLESVRNDIDEFVGEAPQFDDITMLCMDFKAKKQ